MNPRADIWNILHDGEIAGIKRDSHQKLQLRINIPYLRNMFPGDGEDILLNLENCTLFQMEIWDEEITTSDHKKIVATETEILSTESDDVPVKIFSTNGTLLLDFESFTISLDSGEQITFEELGDTCDLYWKNWKKETEAKKK
jgi:hypothetical protein